MRIGPFSSSEYPPGTTSGPPTCLASVTTVDNATSLKSMDHPNQPLWVGWTLEGFFVLRKCLPWTSPFYVGCSCFRCIFSLKQTNKQTNKQANKQTNRNKRFKPTLKLVKFQGESWSDWLLPRVIWLQESLEPPAEVTPNGASVRASFPKWP